MDLLDQVISEKPSFHAAETEVERSFQPSESLLSAREAREVASAGLTCYGVGEDVLRFIADHVNETSRTLETGAGCSTLVFAIQGAHHTAVTPSAAEIDRIKEYAEAKGIELEGVRFVPQASEHYLPVCDEGELDMVLLDGKHAFPWPIVDWFFTADRLKRGGLMLLDDAQHRSVSLVAEFLTTDPGWEQVGDFSGKTLVFKKVRDNVLDVAWHMQPWTVASLPSTPAKVLKKIGYRLRKLRSK